MLSRTSYQRTLRLAGKVLRHPDRAVLRLVLKARLRRTPIRNERVRLLAFLSRQFGVDAASFLTEYRRSEFYSWFRRQRAALDRFKGPYRFGTTGLFGCEALYLLVRATRPRIVVDTGVLYGASTGHILAALADNRSGRLHSIDIGRDPREPPHDYFIPAELQSNWDLITGDSRRELPRLLGRCGTIDMFYHDSLHTWEHMFWEYGTALPHLSSHGILSSDDVQNAPDLPGIFRKNAFPSFCRTHHLPCLTFHNLGVSVLGLTPAFVDRPGPHHHVSASALMS
ncbi:MAG TPA: class I SAM-dependent methyltransferase [Gemmatimonadales bacterium]|nr:class I SAM-dependent methyltransferase [Gemmatimonadales bacterium]